MQKKLLCCLLALGLTFSLSACGGGTESQGNQAQSTGNPGAQTSASDGENGGFESYVFLVTDGPVNYALEVNADMADILEVLGEPQSYFEAESCAFAGLDKTYTYAGFVITTRPEGDQDFVNSILLTDDSVTTQEGVYIGCTESDVTAAYGADGGDLMGMLTYTKGDSTINFIVEDGKVISIEYLPA